MLKHQSNRRRDRKASASQFSLFYESLEPRRVLAAGMLDLGFGDDGIVSTGFVGTDEQAFALQAVQTISGEDKLIVAIEGRSSRDRSLTRFNSDGSLDETFGESGITVSPPIDAVTSIAVQPNGRILTVGRLYSDEIAISRFTETGELDLSFGTDGTVVTEFGYSGQTPWDIEIQADGKFVVVGRTSGNFALLRMDSTGTLDVSFGNGGTVVTDFGGADTAKGVAINSSGDLLVAGETNGGMLLAQYNSSGVLSGIFGTGGQVFDNRIVEVTDVEIQANGQILVAGQTPGNDFGIMRFEDDGQADAAFGAGGLTSTDFFAASDYLNGITIQSDGKIVAAGQAYQSGANVSDFVLARYLPADGSLDAAFGTGGTIVTDFGSLQSEAATAVTIQNISGVDTIVAAGWSILPNALGFDSYDIAMARYRTIDGNLDTTFDSDGLVTTNIAEKGRAAAISPYTNQLGEEKIITAGYAIDNNSNKVGGLGRFNADGTLDSSFGVDGRVVIDSLRSDIIGAPEFEFVQPLLDGKIVVAGTAGGGRSGGRPKYFVSRFNADGTLDNGLATDSTPSDVFGVQGTQLLTRAGYFDTIRGITLQNDGKILVLQSGGGSSSGYVTRLNPDGSIDDGSANDSDPTDQFGDYGQVTIDLSNVYQFYRAIQTQVVDGIEKIIVTGEADSGSQSDIDVALVRLSPDGSFDTSFGQNGALLTDVSGTGSRDVISTGKVQLDGKILVSARSISIDTNYVMRFNADGSLDSAFGSNGITQFAGSLASIRAMDLQSDSKPIVVGFSFVNGTRYATVARYNTNGSIDSAFADAGYFFSTTGPTTYGYESVAVDPAGRIVATELGEGNQIVLTRLSGGVYAGIERSVVGTGPEGGSLTLSGTIAGADPATVTYQWTVSGDASAYTIQSPNLTEQTLDLSLLNDATLTVQLDVSDASGLLASHTEYVSIGNVPATATIGSPVPKYIKGNGNFTATFNAFDPGVNDSISATVDYDDGMGFVNVPINAGKIDLSTNYPFNNQAFTKFITLRLDDGTELSDISMTLVVGTNGQDTIDVALGSTIVTINGQTPVSFDPNAGLFIFGLGDNDVITVDGGIKLNTYLNGGEGDDTLQGGGGRNFYLGGQGIDTVIAESGENILLDTAEQSVITNPTDTSLAVNFGDPLSISTTLFSNPNAVEVDWGDGQVENASIDPTTGFVSGSHAYTVPGNYAVRLTLTDPTVEEVGLTVEVLEPAILPPTAENSTIPLAENTANGTSIGFVSANSSAGSPLSYSVTGGTGEAAFSIDPDSGEIFVANSSLLDHETTQSMDLQIVVVDELGQTATATITFELLNQASITGSVFVDVNGNDLMDANELGIDGVVVELLDETGNAILDDNNQPITATTSDGGFYLFEDLDPGTYRIHEIQPTGVDDGAEILGLGAVSSSLPVGSNDTMQLTLDRENAMDFAFAELGQQLTSGDTASIGFWQNRHGQALINEGGTALAGWLSSSFANIFGNVFDSTSVADFYKQELFKQKSSRSSGPAKVDAQFMATALATYFTSSNLAGMVAASYGFNVTSTGIGTNVVNVGDNGAAFGVADGSDLTIMQLLSATNVLTDDPDNLDGSANIYDTNGDGVIDAQEAAIRTMANSIYSWINEAGNI